MMRVVLDNRVKVYKYYPLCGARLGNIYTGLQRGISFFIRMLLPWEWQQHGSVFALEIDMKRTSKQFFNSKVIFTSPWLLAAAAGILILIVVTFAFHNLGLEKRLMTTAMVQKAATMMRVIRSGAKASYMDDLRRNFWDTEPWHAHVQRVIDHLAEDPDLSYLVVVDKHGFPVAHSDRVSPGEAIQFTEPEMVLNRGKKPALSFNIRVSPQEGRIFEAVTAFFPYRPSIPRIPPIRLSPGIIFKPDSKNRSRYGNPPPHGSEPPDARYFVIVGLDMTEYDRTLGRLRFQIFMLSLAMLLVGLGGWFSLSAVQGYRVSQKTLNEIQAFTSLLVAKLPVGIIATDSTGRVADWNQAIAHITGLEKGETTGLFPDQVLPPDLSVFFARPSGAGRVLKTEDKKRELQLHFNNRDFNLLCQLIIINDQRQRYMGQVLLVSDVTDIKLLEQKMREHERLAAIGKMAGGVAHEVRNPLSSIKGLALLLKNKFDQGSQEQDTAELLIQEAERMNRTISEMLSFTRQVAMQSDRVEMDSLLEQEMQLIAGEAKESDITTHLEIEKGLHPVQGDADRLNQVIMNILLNAIQAMEKGGELTVRASNDVNRDSVDIRIIDTGGGMDRTTLSQIFYPYFTTKKKGSGLGLAISQKIIAEHDGFIEVESEPGKGTTVKLTMPIYRQ